MREDWIEIELGKICNISMGQSPPSSTYNDKGEGMPFFQGKAEFTELYPVVKKWCTAPKKTAKVNDILISVRAPVGATNKTNIDCAIGRGLAAITYPFGNNYLWFYLKFIERALDDQGTGTTFKAISGNILKSQKIPFAPLPEQKSLVSKIEQLFSELDNGIANLKSAKEKLEVYRQSVLKKAFEPLSKSEYLVDIAEVKRGKSKHRPRNDKSLFGGKYPFIQTGEIRSANGGTINSYKTTYSKKGLNQSKLWPKGTLCLTIAANIGETAFLGFDACFPDSVVGINPIEEKLDKKYLNFYIQKIKIEIDSQASATAQKNINVKFLESLQIPLPNNVMEQISISQKIEHQFSVCDKLAESINESLEKSEALRQSILKRAFSGELLTEKELEACKQEADWEPAEKLLEKIKNK